MNTETGEIRDADELKTKNGGKLPPDWVPISRPLNRHERRRGRIRPGDKCGCGLTNKKFRNCCMTKG